MRMPDWRRLLHLPKRRHVHTPEPSSTSPSPSSTKREVPIPVIEPNSLPSPPPATANEVPTSNPEPVLSPPPPVLPPSKNQDAPTPVPEPISIPTPPPMTATNQELPVATLDPNTGLSPPTPVKTTSTSSITKTVGNGLVVGLKLLKEAVTGVGVPGLEATVSGVVGVIDLIKDVRDNTSDLGDLNKLLRTLANAVKAAPNLHQDAEIDGLLRSRIDGFLSDLREMMEQVQEMLSEGVVARTANSQAHKEAIQDLKSGLTFLLNQFTAHGTLSLELNMAGARQDIRMLAKAQEALALAREYEDLIKAIPRAGARYNDTSTKPSRPCHPGTRTGLLEIIVKWIEDPDTTPYFWLCGEVGVGKTTVAHTIAQEQRAMKRLGASFFFSRHDDSRRNPYLLFTSIAYQLARFDQGFYNALAKALKPDPDIVKSTPMEQFKQLVLQPLEQSGMDSSRTVLIVIDGLDECSNPAAILDVLAQGIDDVGVRLRVLISSRPYADILSKFKGRRLYHLTSETQFHDIDPQSLSDDVAAYLSWSLGAIALEAGLPSPWPSKEQLQELIRRAAGLFIIASTYTKYIDDPEVGNPVGQLARIISMQRGMGSSPLAELDALYNQILGDLRSKLTSDVQMANARDIITFVILAPHGINISALAGLFGGNPFDARLVLRRLTAVILLPDDDNGSIAPFHASFGEYIQDSMRCTIRELLVDTETAYGRIAARCGDVIASVLKGGIVGGEYDSARGYSWTPVHLEHSVSCLGTYLSRSSPALTKEARNTIIGANVWPVLRFLTTGWDLSDAVNLIDAVGGSGDLPHMKGSSQDERATSLGIWMIANNVSEVNEMTLTVPTPHQQVEVEAAHLIQRPALKFAKLAVAYSETEGALNIIRCVRCWMKYTHRNIMSFKGVNVTFDDENVPQELVVLVGSPLNVQCSSSLREYLEKNEDLDAVSRLQITLAVADGLSYLHGFSPPQPHNGIGLRQIAVSSEGQPLLYPSRWDLHFQSSSPPSEKVDIDKIVCEWHWDFSPSGWYHWNPTGGDEWQTLLEERLQVDVWDFGSVLYQMIAGEEPLTMYNRLTEGNDDSGHRPGKEKVPGSFWDDDDNYKARYEIAVLVLLDTLQASESIKALLKSCWTIRPQDRPPMNEVFERLKAIVEAMET